MQAKNSYKELHEKQSLDTRYASLCLRPMMWSIMLLRLERMLHSSHRYSSPLPTTVSTTNPRPVTTQSGLLYISTWQVTLQQIHKLRQNEERIATHMCANKHIHIHTLKHNSLFLENSLISLIHLPTSNILI